MFHKSNMPLLPNICVSKTNSQLLGNPKKIIQKRSSLYVRMNVQVFIHSWFWLVCVHVKNGTRASDNAINESISISCQVFPQFCLPVSRQMFIVGFPHIRNTIYIRTTILCILKTVNSSHHNTILKRCMYLYTTKHVFLVDRLYSNYSSIVVYSFTAM